MKGFFVIVYDQDLYFQGFFDSDLEEIGEWQQFFDELVDVKGYGCGCEIMFSLFKCLKELYLGVLMVLMMDYINIIVLENEFEFFGDEEVECCYCVWIWWNVVIMVYCVQCFGIGVGGYILIYVFFVVLYEVGFNYFFKGVDYFGGVDQIFIQGYVFFGIYVCFFFEGCLIEDQFDGFCQEKLYVLNGIFFYLYLCLMLEYWQFLIVLMGFGLINVIYQVMLNKYFENCGIKDMFQLYVWVFFGDGEMDEVESCGQFQVVVNEGFDNFMFVVNCNLQCFDGFVCGNGKIVQEFELFFCGVGWNVIKVVWGCEWDDLFVCDIEGVLFNFMNVMFDGDYQMYKVEFGVYICEYFFGCDECIVVFVKDYFDDDIWNLKCGGYDYCKVYVVFKVVIEYKGKFIVIFVKIVKGYGFGLQFEGCNVIYQMKKMMLDNFKMFCDVMYILIMDVQFEENLYLFLYYNLGFQDEMIQYMFECCWVFGGFFLECRFMYVGFLFLDDIVYVLFKKGFGMQEIVMIMVFVCLFKDLLCFKEFGYCIVLIIFDEVCMFGMDVYFLMVKIYNLNGQYYILVDCELFLVYKESLQGQIVYVGINEVGVVVVFIVVGILYVMYGELFILIYIFYLMFGFQCIGDVQWVVGDQMVCGFIIGVMVGCIILIGEGLQYVDGYLYLFVVINLVMVLYDFVYGYEIVYIMWFGLECMYGGQYEDLNVMYYFIVYNEFFVQLKELEDVDVDGIVCGIYCVFVGEGDGFCVQLFVLGVGFFWVFEVQELFKSDWGVVVDVWLVILWIELCCDGFVVDEYNFLYFDQELCMVYLMQKFQGVEGLVVVVSDFMYVVQDQICLWVFNWFVMFGVDGFGFLDICVVVWWFFKIDGLLIVVCMLQLFVEDGKVDCFLVVQVIEKYCLYDVNVGISGNVGGES